MTVDDATEWVKKNECKIAAYISRYLGSAPYSREDYINDANAAAIEASFRVNKNPTLRFTGVFWAVFRESVARVTPLYKESIKREKGTNIFGPVSMSFPAERHDDIDLAELPAKNKTPGVDLDAVYNNIVKPLLSVSEQKAMELALGLTREGCCSETEIANIMGVSRRSVRTFLDRGYKKAEDKARVIDISSAKKARCENNPVLPSPDDYLEADYM